MKQCFGTSAQMQVGSDHLKREKSHMHEESEVVHDIDNTWKRKGMVSYRPGNESTFKRLFEPASNVDRNQ